MRSKTLPLYREWLAKATPAAVRHVDTIYYECEQRYEQGGHLVVETYEPAELVALSLEEVKLQVLRWHEQATNCRWGEATDPELTALAQCRQWVRSDGTGQETA